MTPEPYAPTVTRKVWGSELLVHNADGYCLKILRFEKGAKLSFHFHGEKTESWYVISGAFRFDTIDPKTAVSASREVAWGSCIHLPRCTLHSLTCLEAGDIAEASTPDDPKDSYRIEPSEAAPVTTTTANPVTIENIRVCPDCDALIWPGQSHFHGVQP